MERKTVILSVLTMTLVMAQIQVKARICCPTTRARNTFDSCSAVSAPLPLCIQFSGCIIIPGNACPPELPASRLEHSGGHLYWADPAVDYCKLGCASSVCGPLTTLHKSDTNDVVGGAIEQCAKACSTFCTNGSTKLEAKTA